MAAESVYALVQVAHNFGAVAVVGGPAAAWWWMREQRVLPLVFAGVTMAGWATQVISGIGFGLTSYLSRGELPEVTGAALFALYIKVGCAMAGAALAGYTLLVTEQKRQQSQRWMWPGLVILGFVALSSAAVLRWLG